jgi:type I restriction enzyme, S subunit
MTKQTSVPKLRFPEFSENWEVKKLGEISIKIGSGSTPNGGEKVYQNTGVIFIRSQNVNDNILKLDDVTFISEEINDKMKGSIVKANDILLNITGASLGRTCVVPSSFNVGNVNQHVCIIRLNNKNNPKFIQTFLSSNKGEKLFLAGQTGSGREGLNFQSIRGFSLATPPLPEQTKIANFLTAIDEKIQGLKEKKSLLEEYKKGLMQQIFSQKLRFKQDNGSDFPDWEEKTLGEVCDLITKGTTPKKFSNKGIKFIKTECFNERGIDNDKCLFVDEIINEKELKRSVLKENDILFAIAGSIGKVRVINKDILPANTNQALAIVRLKKTEINSFIFYILTSKLMEKYILDNITVGAQPNINLEQMNRFCFIYPSKIEQQKIANFLTSIDEKIEKVSQQIGEAETYKKGLLQQMFV